MSSCCHADRSRRQKIERNEKFAYKMAYVNRGRVTPEHRVTSRRGRRRWNDAVSCFFSIRRIEGPCMCACAPVDFPLITQSQLLLHWVAVVEILENFPINGPAKGIARLTAAVGSAPVSNVKCGWCLFCRGGGGGCCLSLANVFCYINILPSRKNVDICTKT